MWLFEDVEAEKPTSELDRAILALAKVRGHCPQPPCNNNNNNNNRMLVVRRCLTGDCMHVAHQVLSRPATNGMRGLHRALAMDRRVLARLASLSQHGVHEGSEELDDPSLRELVRLHNHICIHNSHRLFDSAFIYIQRHCTGDDVSGVVHHTCICLFCRCILITVDNRCICFTVCKSSRRESMTQQLTPAMDKRTCWWRRSQILI